MNDASTPRGGIDYPRTFQEFEAWFGSEAACRTYLRRLRWADGFVCPVCGVADQPAEMSRGLLRCRACGRQVSLTAGTIFQDTRKPLRTWFLAMWFITSQKNGVSALGLQRVLGLGSYETAWTWLHKLRRAMIRPGRDCLHGEIEVDETYVGAPEEGARGRETAGKAIVVIAVEKDGRGFGRVRLRRIPDVSTDSLLGFVRDTVEPGSAIQTDRMVGAAMSVWTPLATRIRSLSSAPVPIRHTSSCRASTKSPRCSSDGSWGLSKVESNTSISTTTSTNSPSASTAAGQRLAECSSTVSPSKQWPSALCPIATSSMRLVTDPQSIAFRA